MVAVHILSRGRKIVVPLMRTTARSSKSPDDSPVVRRGGRGMISFNNLEMSRGRTSIVLGKTKIRRIVLLD